MMLFSDANLVPGQEQDCDIVILDDLRVVSFSGFMWVMVLNILKEANVIKDNINNPDHS